MDFISIYVKKNAISSNCFNWIGERVQGWGRWWGDLSNVHVSLFRNVIMNPSYTMNIS
jgi:hypothetical protein